MKEIPLTQGMVAIVDDEDYKGLVQFKWHYSKSSASKTGYAQRNIRKQNGRQIQILMHRIILNTPCGYDTDHINHNGLDNRRNNLRVATHAQNLYNKGKQRNNTSGHKGVWWNKNRGKWTVYITFNNKSIYLGLFKDKLEAARAYNEAAIKYHGDFAIFNKEGI